jgi:hypothetical protein
MGESTMEETSIGQILTHYYEEYEKVFSCFAFSEKADRFTEENQTVNFCQAVKRKYPDAVVWYEYPFPGDKYANRFDAVIYIPEKNCLLIVEAKCLRHTRKYIAMKNDLVRICERGRQNINLKDSSIQPAVYAVILADYWASKQKYSFINVLQDWEKKSKDDIVSVETEFKKFKDYAFEHLVQWPDWKVKPILASNNKEYHLLTLIGEVKV